MPRQTPAAVFVLLLAGVATAAGPKKVHDDHDPRERVTVKQPPTIVDRSEAMLEADFRFVGEYAGFEWPTGSPRSSRKVSLQVNATGGGSFVATRTIGGTPDQPDAAADVARLAGHRRGDKVVLRDLAPSAYRLEYVLDGYAATVRTPGLGEAGRLERSFRSSPTLGQAPPPGAVVLYDGRGTSRLVNARVTPDGLLQQGTETVDPWTDFRLHLEFRLPYKPNARGQARGNSGVYIQSRYELQVLDSFGWPAAFNDVGALYRTVRPARNASLPPLDWQTYDIDFTAPRFAGETKTAPGRLTVWLNGVKIHDNLTIPRKTGLGQPEAGFPLPTKLQAHGNPVRYRNVWLLEDGQPGPFGAPPPATPVPPVPVAGVPVWP